MYVQFCRRWMCIWEYMSWFTFRLINPWSHWTLLTYTAINCINRPTVLKANKHDIRTMNMNEKKIKSTTTHTDIFTWLLCEKKIIGNDVDRLKCGNNEWEIKIFANALAKARSNLNLTERSMCVMLLFFCVFETERRIKTTP